MADNEISLKNFTPPSAVPNKDQGNVSRKKLSGQPVLESSGGAWGMSPGSHTHSSSGQLTSTWSVEPTEINSSEDDMDTRSDANSRLVSTPLGEPKSPLKISGDLGTTDQASKAQSAGRIPPSHATAPKVSSVTANLSADVVSFDQWRSSQQDHSDTYGITLSAHREIELVTRPQSRDKMEAPVTLTPAHDLSTHSSILVDEGVVEMSPGSGCANRVERSSTASDTTWTESQDQNALPGVPAKPSELITPQSDQDRKQESESDQHTLFFSHITDIPTSESPSVQNANTENLVNSFKMNSVAGVNQPDPTHWALNFKATSSDFDGTVTPALSQVKIKSLSSSWNIFEFPELLTHSSNLPVQEVTNGAETDTATLSYESGPRSSERRPEIPPVVATLSGAVATQSAGSQFPVMRENAFTTQGVWFANRIPSSISFNPGMTLVAISADGNGGVMVSSEAMEDSGGATGRGSETENTRDTSVEDGGNVTMFTSAKDSMTTAIATRTQRLEVTPAAKSSSGISVIFDLSGTEKDVNRLKAVPDSMTKTMVTTEPSGKTIRFEGGTSPPSNSGGPNTGGLPTEGNFVSGEIVPIFSPRTSAPEPITLQPPANASLPSVEVDHSASPPQEIFPTTLSLTGLSERTSTVLEGSTSLTNTRGTIAPTSSKTTMPRPDNPMSSSGRTDESQTSADERLRETSAPVMNQAFQDATVLSRPVDASGYPSFTPESLDQTQSATRPATLPHLPVPTYSVVSVTNLAQPLPSVPTVKTVSQSSTDQTGIGSSQTLGSSSVSGRGEPAWPTTVNLKFTIPPLPASSSVEEEENIATSEGTPLSWTLPLNQLASEPTDGSPGLSVSHVDTNDLNTNRSQSPQPGGSEQWQREILSTLAAAHSATIEGFRTWDQSDLGILSTGHGVDPTLGSSVSPEGTTSLPTAAVLSPRNPTTPTRNRDNSWALSRDETSLSSPIPAMGTLTSLMPTSQPLHSDVNPTPSERAAQTTVHQPTQGTLGEVMTSILSFTPTEKRKQIFIVGNELPLIKEGLRVKIPTKLILDMNFTLQLGDSTSEEYQNLAEDFTHKVSPFYKKVPGFQQLLVKHFR
ncbi:mucin-6-like [Scyliorhinus canicula]|uniref:mucin-6-like n=1 Tax=Scyliorhinus canicula TaxID=7830 RepID=UPI0018F51D80|nr:mucin-6-like [Scyliorhinus canicula]